MNALTLSRMYYETYCAPMLREQFPELARRVAAGLVGEGSECLGFDDTISQDHDWGAAVCLWLEKQDYQEHGTTLQHALAELPQSIQGYPVRQESAMAAGRSGVLEIEQFYYRHIGYPQGPKTLADWLRIQETRLNTTTNGAVFADPAGQFTAIRRRLLAFYPEDVRKKKLAARCATIAQAGQYNLPRCVKRREYVAAAMAESQFMDGVCSAVFLLNKQYMPFYKWAHKALRALPLLGAPVATQLSDLVALAGGNSSSYEKKIELIEEISVMLIEVLTHQELSDSQSSFLLDHAFAIQNSISDSDIKAVNVFLG